MVGRTKYEIQNKKKRYFVLVSFVMVTDLIYTQQKSISHIILDDTSDCTLAKVISRGMSHIHPHHQHLRT